VLEVAPPLAEEQLAAVPAKRGVVLLEGERATPLLLLTAADMRARLRSRLSEDAPAAGGRRADLRRVTRRIRWRTAGSHFGCDLRFLEIARVHWPHRWVEWLAWKPPWFVHVDRDDDAPHFRRTRDVLARPGRYWGPFPNAKAAESFLENLRDVFGLCRDPAALRQAPHGARCVYAEMGRCCGGCEGRISMDAYRRLIDEAGRFITADRTARAAELTAQMNAAAAALDFERAAELKKRLRRLEAMSGPAYRHVAPAEQFRFVLVEPSGSRRAVETFLCHRGWVADGPRLDVPLQPGQLAAALEGMAERDAAPLPMDAAGRYRMGLVAQALFASVRRRGLIVRWRPGRTAAELRRRIEEAAEGLGIPAGRREGATRQREPSHEQHEQQREPGQETGQAHG